ncbi:MAG: hypothetical protein ACD_50C00273G0002 [uncultured bacterium]|nr:MAG: hypothetical protein ACD_50C00273G0002 [uncultured bacterium]
MKKTNQIEFASILYDTIFGLILYFGIDSFLDIREPVHFVFYFFSNIILIHWWLIFKSTDDTFGDECSDSVLDLVLGIIYLILIEFVVLFSRSFDYEKAFYFLIALLGVDLVWALMWKFIGKWRTKSKAEVRHMERELSGNIWSNVVILILLVPLFALINYISAGYFVLVFILTYLVYILLTFKYKIIDIKWF